MIPRTAQLWQTSAWQKSLTDAITQPEALFDYLELDKNLLPAAQRASQQFSLRVPQGYAALMEKGNLADPLLRQVFPIDAELQTTEGFSTDPVGDIAATTQPGLLHKYHGRALLITTGACAIHCRFCFRRHFPYEEATGVDSQWESLLGHLNQTPEIQEIILSGGDPLMLSDDKLALRIRTLEAIPHIKRLRIHTRLPIVLPERVCDPLLQWLRDTRLRTVIVVHSNHANELGTEAQGALRRLKEADVTLLNQSVLLKGVNDCPKALAQLSESLFDCGVLPYYLHLLDRVEGAAHFEVPQDRIRALDRELRKNLPGYLVPRLVREERGEPSKTPLI
ncbi:EF-P beta-lysylation protein EpmB [Pseudomonadota bacterium]